jgi:V8-like Glu-specific endopeptidase
MEMTKRRIAVVVAGTLGAILLLAGPAAATESTDAVQKRLDPAGVRAFWTPARMAEAEPLDAPRDPLAPLLERIPAAPPKFNTGPVRNPASQPYPAVGKVFFQLGGNLYSCSAAIVKAPGRSLVWTAGHCIYDHSGGGSFATQWAFLPDYDDGSMPFGIWPAQQVIVPTKWTKRNQHFDFGAAVIAAKGGQLLEDVVGTALPFGANPKYDQRWKAVGFPSANKFDDQMWQCSSPLHRKDRFRGSGPAPIGIGCNMTGGASGGPWITKKGKLGAVTSYGYKGERNALYGTYLGSLAKSMFKDLRDEVGSSP